MIPYNKMININLKIYISAGGGQLCHNYVEMLINYHALLGGIIHNLARYNKGWLRHFKKTIYVPVFDQFEMGW